MRLARLKLKTDSNNRVSKLSWRPDLCMPYELCDGTAWINIYGVDGEIRGSYQLAVTYDEAVSELNMALIYGSDEKANF